MSWFKKALLLFLALLLPIAVFIFLKAFGKNEFAVQPLFQEEFEAPINCKSFSFRAPYVIHDSVLSQVGWIKNDSITVFILTDGSPENHHLLSTQVDRIFTELSSKNFHIVILSEIKNDGVKSTAENKSTTVKELRELNQYKNCIFLLKDSQHALIVDSKKRIRGQYDLSNLDDADRFIMELQIILKEY